MAKKYRRLRRKKRKTSSWRTLKKKFQLKKRLRRVTLASIVFFGVLLTLGTIYVYHYLTRPFARASGSFINDITWDGETPLNLLFIVPKEGGGETASLQAISIVSLNPSSQRLTVLNLPRDYQVSLSAHGRYPLRALYGLGNLEDSQEGIALTAKTVSRLLGISIDGYLELQEAGFREFGNLFEGVAEVQGYFSLANISLLPKVLSLSHEHLRTNLSLGELTRAVRFIWKVRGDKVEVLSLSKSALRDWERLDYLLSPFWEDENFVGERLRIQVLNGTTKPGLASFASRIIENLGGEVVRADNYERQDLTRGFLVLNQSGSYTAKRLAYIFGVVDSRPPQLPDEKRADITIILGIENYQKFF
jgi:hypothetical protein